MAGLVVLFGLLAVTCVSCQEVPAPGPSPPAPIPVPAPELIPIECSEDCLQGTENNMWVATRLWLLKDGASVSNSEVADAKKEGFAPIVTQQEGFNEYLGAPIFTDTNLTFFMNIFDTQAQASEASLDAEAFVGESSLSSQVELVDSWFMDGQFEWLFHECTSNPTGAFLAVRRSTLIEGAEITLKDVTDERLELYAPLLSASPGFLAYGAALVENNLGESSIFSYAVFDTLENWNSAIGTEAIARAREASKYGEGEFQTIERYDGFVNFDFVCQQRDDSTAPAANLMEKENL